MIPVILVVALVGGFLVFRSFATTALLGNDGEYVPIAPARLYDTRTAGTKAPLKGGQALTIPATNRIGIPADVKAIVAYISAVGPATNGYTRVGAGGQVLTATQQNYSKGQSVTNQVTIPVSSKGEIKLWTSASSHFVVDVHGYISTETGADGLRYAPAQSTRAYDTRKNGTKTPVAAGRTLTFDIAGKAGIPPEARAVSISLSSVSPAKSGYARMWPGGASSSPITILNYTKGQSITGQVTVPLDGSGKLTLFTSAQSHFTFDVTGYYGAETPYETSRAQRGRFVPIAGKRVLDTRTGGGMVKANGTRNFYVDMSQIDPKAYHTDIPVVSVTAVGPNANGFARIGTEDNLSATQLNYTKGQSITNQFVTPVGANPTDSYYSYKIWTSQQSHYVVDVVGYIKSTSEDIGGYGYTYSMWGENTLHDSISFDVRYSDLDGYPDDNWLVSVRNNGFISAIKLDVTAPDENIYWYSGVGSMLNTKKFISLYTEECLNAGRCEILATDTQTVGQNTQIPFNFANNKTYTITRDLRVNEANYPGTWEVISISDGSHKTDLIKTQIASEAYRIKLIPRIGGNSYGGGINAREGCSGVIRREPRLWIGNLKADYRPFNITGSSIELQNSKDAGCKGVNRIDYGSNPSSFTISRMIPSSQRDVTNPTISNISLSEPHQGWKQITVKGEDDNALAFMTASVKNKDGTEFNLYGTGEGTLKVGKERTQHFSIYNDSTPSTPYPSGTDVVVRAYDNSGNVTEKVYKLP